MNSHKVSDAITKMTWIDKFASPIQKGTARLYKNARGIEEFFHGKFVGHPLHPALVHLPVGCFMLAAITDLFAFDRTEASVSYIAIWVGVIAAIPAMIAGLTDWYPYGDTSVRRIGGLHMLLNVTAVLFYAVSLAFRAGGMWGGGLLWGYLGFLTVMFSGYLGGLLSYGKQIGTDHAPLPEDEAAPNEYVAVFRLEDLTENQPTKARVSDVAIVLVRRGDHVFALANACAHEGGPLNEGEVKGSCIVCPWHQTSFRLRDGAVIDGPCVYAQTTFRTRIKDGMVEVLAVRQLESTEHPMPGGSASLR